MGTATPWTNVANGDTAIYDAVQQLLDALQGTSSGNRLFTLTGIDDDLHYAVDILNSGSGGKGLRVRSSTGSNLLTVSDSGITGPGLSAVDVLAYNVQNYGAVGDGATDDTAAIQDAIDACGDAGGGKVWFPPGVYNVSDTILVGDGTGSVSALSDRRNITLAGAGKARLNGNFYGVSALSWTGSAGGTMLSFVGQETCGMKDLDLHGNSGALKLCTLLNVNYMAMRRVSLRHPETNGVCLELENVNQGHFQHVTIVCQIAGAKGLTVGLNAAYDSYSNSQNLFEHFTILHDGQNTGEYGIHLRFCDNNTFDRVTTLPVGLTGDGLHFEQCGPSNGFPGENYFENCAFIGGISGNPGTGGAIFFPYPTSDGEGIPALTNCSFFTYDHRDYGYGDGDTGAISLFNSKLRAEILPPESFSTIASATTLTNPTSATSFDKTRTLTAGKANRAGDLIKVRAWGSVTVGAGAITSDVTVRLRFGTVTMGNVTLSAVPAGTYTWVAEYVLCVESTGAAADVQAAGGWLGMGTLFKVSTTTGRSTFDMTASQAIAIRGLFGTSDGSNTITMNNMIVRVEHSDHTA